MRYHKFTLYWLVLLASFRPKYLNLYCLECWFSILIWPFGRSLNMFRIWKYIAYDILKMFNKRPNSQIDIENHHFRQCKITQIFRLGFILIYPGSYFQFGWIDSIVCLTWIWLTAFSSFFPWANFTMGPNEQNQHIAELRQKVFLYTYRRYCS